VRHGQENRPEDVWALYAYGHHRQYYGQITVFRPVTHPIPPPAPSLLPLSPLSLFSLYLACSDLCFCFTYVFVDPNPVHSYVLPRQSEAPALPSRKGSGA
jgi:hypothetical protein